jgi:hypothetical protein
MAWRQATALRFIGFLTECCVHQPLRCSVGQGRRPRRPRPRRSPDCAFFLRPCAQRPDSTSTPRTLVDAALAGLGIVLDREFAGPVELWSCVVHIDLHNRGGWPWRDGVIGRLGRIVRRTGHDVRCVARCAGCVRNAGGVRETAVMADAPGSCFENTVERLEATPSGEGHRGRTEVPG